MAYVKTWSTKEEVLKDLAKASGRRTRKKDDLDSGYLVIGDVPPHVIPENEDATELEIRFGGAASGKEIHTEEDAPPDLAGIQHMLRMMQGYNSGDDTNTDDAVNTNNCVVAITKVSRLNPNVEEFKPSGFTAPSPSRNSNKYSNSPRKNNISSCLSNKDINSNVVVQTVDVKTEESQTETEDEVKGKESGDNNHFDVAVHVDKSGDNNDLDVAMHADESGDNNHLDGVVHADKNEYNNIATTLKNQISDAAKTDSYEFKKQRNVAIATLLKLYANNNTEAKCAAPLKLIKPEYFEGKVEIPVVKVEKLLDIESTATSPTPEPKDSCTTLASCSTFSISTSSSSSSPKIKLDPEIKKSINKVNQWLGEPTKSKSPAVCLAPIAFKRKEPKISCKSPGSDSAPRPPKPAVQSQKYQPSKYAADLEKQYLERHKEMELKQKEVTWHNLEDVLKEKDLAIKKRLEEQAEQDQASTSDT